MRKVLKKLLIISNIIVVFITLISLIVPYINPLKFKFLYFTGLLFPVFIFLNIVFLIVWLMFLKRWVFLSLLVLIFAIPVINRFYKVRIFVREPKHEGIKLMSYNVRMFNYYDWIQKSGISDKIFKFLKEQNPDLLCIQEFSPRFKKGEINILDSLKSVFYYHIIKYPTKYKNKVGLAIFSKYRILQSDFLEFENSANGILTCDLLVGSEILKIVNVHLQSTNLNKSDFYFLDNLFNNGNNIENIKNLTKRLKDAYIKRSFQVETLNKIIKNSNKNIIVCGDFNDTPVSYTYQQISNLLDDTFIKVGKGWGITYIGRFPGFRIDYVFIGQKIEPLKYSISKIRLSDHYPIIFNFKFKN